MASIVAKIIGDGKGFDKTVAGVQGKLTKLKSAIGALGLTVGVGAVTSFAKSLIDTGSRLTDVADKLGISTEFLQKFNFAAQENGIANTASEMALQRFVRRLGEAQQGTGELLPSLEQYNIALFDSEGRARSAEEVLRDYAETIKNTEDPQERLRLAFKAFDSEGAALVSVLKEGASGLDEYFNRAEKLNQVISDEQLQRMDKYADRIDRWTTAFKTLSTESLGTLLGQLEKLGERLDFTTTDEERAFDGLRKEAMAFFEANNMIIEQMKQINAGGFSGIFGGSIEIAEQFVEISGKLVPLEEALVVQANLIKSAKSETKQKAEEIAATEIDIEAIKSRQRAQAEGLVAIYEDINTTEEARLEREKELTAEKEKQTAELEKQQAAAQAQLSTLQQQSAAFESTGQFGFSFQDILSGTFSTRAQADAERVLELQARAQQALFFSGEDSEAFQRASGFARKAQTEFENRYGVDPVENPFKDALKNAEDELKQINEKFDAL